MNRKEKQISDLNSDRTHPEQEEDIEKTKFVVETKNGTSIYHAYFIKDGQQQIRKWKIAKIQLHNGTEFEFGTPLTENNFKNEVVCKQTSANGDVFVSMISVNHQTINRLMDFISNDNNNLVNQFDLSLDRKQTRNARFISSTGVLCQGLFNENEEFVSGKTLMQSKSFHVVRVHPNLNKNNELIVFSNGEIQKLIYSPSNVDFKAKMISVENEVFLMKKDQTSANFESRWNGMSLSELGEFYKGVFNAKARSGLGILQYVKPKTDVEKVFKHYEEFKVLMQDLNQFMSEKWEAIHADFVCSPFYFDVRSKLKMSEKVRKQFSLFLNVETNKTRENLSRKETVNNKEFLEIRANSAEHISSWTEFLKKLEGLNSKKEISISEIRSLMEKDPLLKKVKLEAMFQNFLDGENFHYFRNYFQNFFKASYESGDSNKVIKERIENRSKLKVLVGFFKSYNFDDFLNEEGIEDFKEKLMQEYRQFLKLNKDSEPVYEKYFNEIVDPNLNFKELNQRITFAYLEIIGEDILKLESFKEEIFKAVSMNEQEKYESLLSQLDELLIETGPDLRTNELSIIYSRFTNQKDEFKVFGKVLRQDEFEELKKRASNFDEFRNDLIGRLRSKKTSIVSFSLDPSRKFITLFRKNLPILRKAIEKFTFTYLEKISADKNESEIYNQWILSLVEKENQKGEQILSEVWLIYKTSVDKELNRIPKYLHKFNDFGNKVDWNVARRELEKAFSREKVAQMKNYLEKCSKSDLKLVMKKLLFEFIDKDMDSLRLPLLDELKKKVVSVDGRDTRKIIAEKFNQSIYKDNEGFITPIFDELEERGFGFLDQRDQSDLKALAMFTFTLDEKKYKFSERRKEFSFQKWFKKYFSVLTPDQIAQFFGVSREKFDEEFQPMNSERFFTKEKNRQVQSACMEVKDAVKPFFINSWKNKAHKNLKECIKNACESERWRISEKIRKCESKDEFYKILNNNPEVNLKLEGNITIKEKVSREFQNELMSRFYIQSEQTDEMNVPESELQCKVKKRIEWIEKSQQHLEFLLKRTELVTGKRRLEFLQKLLRKLEMNNVLSKKELVFLRSFLSKTIWEIRQIQSGEESEKQYAEVEKTTQKINSKSQDFEKSDLELDPENCLFVFDDMPENLDVTKSKMLNQNILGLKAKKENFERDSHEKTEKFFKLSKSFYELLSLRFKEFQNKPMDAEWESVKLSNDRLGLVLKSLERNEVDEQESFMKSIFHPIKKTEKSVKLAEIQNPEVRKIQELVDQVKAALSVSQLNKKSQHGERGKRDESELFFERKINQLETLQTSFNQNLSEQVRQLSQLLETLRQIENRNQEKEEEFERELQEKFQRIHRDRHLKKKIRQVLRKEFRILVEFISGVKSDTLNIKNDLQYKILMGNDPQVTPNASNVYFAKLEDLGEYLNSFAPIDSDKLETNENKISGKENEDSSDQVKKELELLEKYKMECKKYIEKKMMELQWDLLQLKNSKEQNDQKNLKKEESEFRDAIKNVKKLILERAWTNLEKHFDRKLSESEDEIILEKIDQRIKLRDSLVSSVHFSIVEALFFVHQLQNEILSLKDKLSCECNLNWDFQVKSKAVYLEKSEKEDLEKYLDEEIVQKGNRQSGLSLNDLHWLKKCLDLNIDMNNNQNKFLRRTLKKIIRMKLPPLKNFESVVEEFLVFNQENLADFYFDKKKKLSAEELKTIEEFIGSKENEKSPEETATFNEYCKKVIVKFCKTQQNCFDEQKENLQKILKIDENTEFDENICDFVEGEKRIHFLLAKASQKDIFDFQEEFNEKMKRIREDCGKMDTFKLRSAVNRFYVSGKSPLEIDESDKKSEISAFFNHPGLFIKKDTIFNRTKAVMSIIDDPVFRFAFKDNSFSKENVPKETKVEESEVEDEDIEYDSDIVIAETEEDPNENLMNIHVAYLQEKYIMLFEKMVIIRHQQTQNFEFLHPMSFYQYYKTFLNYYFSNDVGFSVKKTLIGFFKDNLFYSGIQITNKGDIYIGFFSKNMYHGKGTMIIRKEQRPFQGYQFRKGNSVISYEEIFNSENSDLVIEESSGNSSDEKSSENAILCDFGLSALKRIKLSGFKYSMLESDYHMGVPIQKNENLVESKLFENQANEMQNRPSSTRQDNFEKIPNPKSFFWNSKNIDQKQDSKQTGEFMPADIIDNDKKYTFEDKKFDKNEIEALNTDQGF